MALISVISTNIYSPLGKTTTENFEQLLKNNSGLRLHAGNNLSEVPFYASLFDHSAYRDGSYTKFEQLLINSITGAMENCNIDLAGKNTLLIISSTKGNISLLEEEKESSLQSESLRKRISLPASAKLVAGHFKFFHQPLIISNACISGIAAMITAMRLLQARLYEHIVIAGADIISKFILSGFESFQAISPVPCKPFDAGRKGINLGEAGAAVILSTQKGSKQDIQISGGAISNDANHISGPSRTGEELALAINNSMKQSGISFKDIDYVSAHGTGTMYNDEMEAKALAISGLQAIPVNSLKGYFGHTLGAAGLVESIIAMRSMQEETIIGSRGYEQHGVSVELNISSQHRKAAIKNILKTASGFGGCNAAIILSKQ